MRKEILFAVLAGVVFGLVVAFGIWRANSALKNKVNDRKETNLTQEPTSVPQAEFKLTLYAPEEASVTTTAEVKISALTKAGSWIVISGETKDYIIQSQDGSFEQIIDLTPGINQLLIAAFEKDKKTEQELTLVFSSEFSKEIATSESEEEATKAGDPIRERVKEKVQEAASNPKAFIGTVTDKSQDSIQIKNQDGEIQLISLQEEATFVKINDRTTTIKFSDVAIGDFIAALGFSDENALSAKRILVTQALEPLKRKIILGKVTKINKNNVTLEDSKGLEWILEFPRRWDGPDIDELFEEDELIAVGEPKNSNITIRTIFVTQKAP